MKTYQPKVSTTQQYSDGQGDHIVHPAKLMFLTEQSPLWEEGGLFREVDTDRIFRGDHSNTGVQRNSTFERINPIIISETEEIKEGDWFYDSKNKVIKQTIMDYTKIADTRYKILALPEHFSDKHLQAIVDGKMKEGKLLIKCDEYSNNDPLGGYAVKYYKKIHLNQQNHITLFPAKQSLEEFIESELKFVSFSDNPVRAFVVGVKKGAEWAKNNNY